jgi:hypothetical protein
MLESLSGSKLISDTDLMDYAKKGLALMNEGENPPSLGELIASIIHS